VEVLCLDYIAGAVLRQRSKEVAAGADFSVAEAGDDIALIKAGGIGGSARLHAADTDHDRLPGGVWADVPVGEEVAAGAALSSPQAASTPASEDEGEHKGSVRFVCATQFSSFLPYDTTIR
jgi:hypothetical protein